MRRQPALQVRQVQSIKPGAIGVCELANEWKDGNVGKAYAIAEQIILVLQPGIQGG